MITSGGLYKKFVDDEEMLLHFFDLNKRVNLLAETIADVYDRNQIDLTLLKNCECIYTSDAVVPEEYCIDVPLKRYPLYWMYGRQTVNYETFITKERRFCSLNGAKSPIRTQLVDYLLSYKDYGYISDWNRGLKLDSETNIESWHNVKRHRPSEWYNSDYDINIESGSSHQPKQFTQITEKTFLPLLAGKMFLNFGFPGMYKCLNEWGFELADDIDYTFDNNSNFELYKEQVLKLVGTNNEKYHALVLRNKSTAKKLYEENYNEYVTNKPISDKDFVLDDILTKYLNNGEKNEGNSF